ncbi:hypothetical protein F4859DRAFT_519838 [Xylaria cf. heliscus]|nr:hypothetical protein F4859DRAFT_519838 [Xylaria cf. heliscus]
MFAPDSASTSKHNSKHNKLKSFQTVISTVNTQLRHPSDKLLDITEPSTPVIIITYSCGCKPYKARKPCNNPDCTNVERIYEPPCALCVKEELEKELERSHRKS